MLIMLKIYAAMFCCTFHATIMIIKSKMYKDVLIMPRSIQCFVLGMLCINGFGFTGMSLTLVDLLGKVMEKV